MYTLKRWDDKMRLTKRFYLKALSYVSSRLWKKSVLIFNLNYLSAFVAACTSVAIDQLERKQ